MKVRGRIKKLFPMKSGVSRLGNNWRRQDFILEFFAEPTDQYADTVQLSVMNDKIDEFALNEGDEVNVEVRHQVKTYGERLYNDLWVKTLEKVGSGTQAPATDATVDATAATTSANVQPTEEQKAAMEKLKQMGEAAASGEGGDEDELPF